MFGAAKHFANLLGNFLSASTPPSLVSSPRCVYATKPHWNTYEVANFHFDHGHLSNNLPVTHSLVHH